MKLDLTEDQIALRDHMRNFFQRESDPGLVRAAEPLGFDPDLWDKAARIGLAGMCIPEDLGGGGSDLLDAALVVEQVGRSVAPVPVVEQMVAGRLLSRTAPADQEQFARLAAGDVRATVALSPAVDGTWRLVPAGAVADVVVGIDGGKLVAAASSPPMAGPRNHACSPISDRATAGAEVTLLQGDAEADHAAAVDDWKTLTAAALVGLAARALEIGVEYAKARHQFGRPIGSFQAVQHGLADVVAPIDGARLLVGRAAWACDHDSADRGRLASMAFLFAAETAKTATARALHYHGGYGVMNEYDIQMYYRRARGWPLQYQDLEREYLQLGDHLFGAPASA